MRILKISLWIVSLLLAQTMPVMAQSPMGEKHHMMMGPGSKSQSDMMGMHQKMADMHKKMSECLKTKSMEDCQAEMKKECQGMMKTCPMMDANYCPMMSKMTNSENK